MGKKDFEIFEVKIKIIRFVKNFVTHSVHTNYDVVVLFFDLNPVNLGVINNQNYVKIHQNVDMILVEKIIFVGNFIRKKVILAPNQVQEI